MKEIELLELLAHINSITKNNSDSCGICLFIGAGADISSGGVTFSQLKRNCLEENNYRVNDLSSDEKIDIIFDDFFSSLSDTRRCDVLRFLLETSTNMDISDGYKILCLLAKEHIISSVVTTNFDNLLERTQELLRINDFSIFAPGISVPVDHYIKTKSRRPIYLKMHGDIDGKLVTHLTKNEILNHDYMSEFTNLFKYIITNETVIFIGYSGYDNKIAEIFDKCLNELKDIYWININPPDSDAPLVKVLNKKNAINYLQMNFDESMQSIAASILRDKMLFNIDSVFIWALIYSKIENLQRIFLGNLSYPLIQNHGQNLIPRKEISDKLLDFIFSDRRNLCIISGNSGVGKTSLIGQLCNRVENNMHIVPIRLNQIIHANNIDIWGYITKLLGYVTNNPLAVLYQFADWIQSTNRRVVFVFDDVDKTSNDYNNTIINLLAKLIELSYIMRNFQNVKFIITLRTLTWNNVYKYLDNNYLKDVLYCEENKDSDIKSLRLEIFTDFELHKAVNKYKRKHNVIYIDDRVKELMRNPAFFGMLMHMGNNTQSEYLTYSDCFLAIQNDSLDKTQQFQQERFLIDCAKHMFEKKVLFLNINDSTDLILLDRSCSDGILFVDKNKIIFTYDLFFEHYFAEYLCEKDIMDIDRYEFDEFVNIFLINSTDREYNGLIAYMSLLNPNFGRLLIFLSDLLDLAEEQNIQKRIYKFIQDIFNSCARYRDTYIKDILLISDSILRVFFKPILYSICYMPDRDAFKMLELLRDMENMTFETQMFINTRFSNGLMSALIEKKHSTYFSNYKKYLEYGDNKLYYIVNLLHITANIGIDNTAEEEYNVFLNIIKNELHSTLNKHSYSDMDFCQITNSFSRNAYSIFFNADIDIYEKYHSFRMNSSIIKIIEKFKNSGKITEQDIKTIRTVVNNLDSPIEFFVCNIIFMALTQQNKAYALQCFDSLYRSFGTYATAPDIDFYLSAVFMSFYLYNPKDRTDHLKRFSAAITDFETIMFHSAAKNRSASRRKFEDEFILEFEDGFNALTNYTYTAPSCNYMQHSSSKHESSNYLSIFWELKDKLDKMGDNKNIIRLIHAIGQMIALWPKEGFEALSKFTNYNQTLIRKAVIHVLTENYIKQPYETYRFLESTGNAFDSNELLTIKSGTDSKTQLKTLEQLHWVRMFYFILHAMNPKYLDELLDIILQSYNLKDAIIKLFEKLHNQDNSELIYQID